jgi:hypothetical protein
LVGQTGTSQMHKFIKLDTEFKIKQTINNNDAFVYQGVNPGQIIVSGNNTSAKTPADVDQKE